MPYILPEVVEFIACLSELVSEISGFGHCGRCHNYAEKDQGGECWQRWDVYVYCSLSFNSFIFVFYESLTLGLTNIYWLVSLWLWWCSNMASIKFDNVVPLITLEHHVTQASRPAYITARRVRQTHSNGVMGHHRDFFFFFLGIWWGRAGCGATAQHRDHG